MLRIDKIEYVLNALISDIPDKKHVEDVHWLSSLYAPQAQTTEYETLQDLFKCKLHDEGKVYEHVSHMIGLIERLTSFGTVGMPELHNMLTTYESSTAKGKSLLMVGSSANSSKWKNEQPKKITSKDIVLKPKGEGVKKKPILFKDE
ncbi:hypothetical protein SASPL_128251 [Salvia splendens]|uniref:Uncharacterized protein n=1 Tax=Salvia splendens TaxID=180675 RepID=A0A8X8XCQ9_SALSN|nr:hypothetical protein SASPL_128251 [Salvia splendens]